jgi:hypothetical protein
MWDVLALMIVNQMAKLYPIVQIATMTTKTLLPPPMRNPSREFKLSSCEAQIPTTWIVLTKGMFIES